MFEGEGIVEGENLNGITEGEEYENDERPAAVPPPSPSAAIDDDDVVDDDDVDDDDDNDNGGDNDDETNDNNFANVDEDREYGSSSLVEELENKYLTEVDMDESIIILKSLTGTSPCKLASEHSLWLIVLDHKSIDRIGNRSRFLTVCRKAREVHLSWNKFSSWREIRALLSLPELEVLNLSYNPLQPSILETDIPVAKNLRVIVLNGTNLPMSTLQKLLINMPKLKELHFSGNRELEQHIDISDEVISESLKVLTLNNCNIVNWETVIRLRKFFPNVTRLSLCTNSFRSTVLESNSVEISYLNGISRISLNECLIDNWQSIECLAHISTLQDLRIISIPLWNKHTKEEYFRLVVALIPQLKIFNGSVISDQLRVESERYLIRYYDMLETKPKIYTQLIKRHGRVEQLCVVDLTPKKEAVVTVICEETGLRKNLTLNLTETVSCLMRVLEKLTKIPSRRMRLVYSNSATASAAELRFPSCKLWEFSIEDDGEIHVQSKILLGRRKKNR